MTTNEQLIKTIPLLLITSSMDNNEIYIEYINNRKLNRKYFVYNDIKYQVKLGEDLLELIKHRHFLTKQRNMRTYNLKIKTRTRTE